MEFGLAFMTPGPKRSILHVNTMSPEQANIDCCFKSRFVIFFEFFRNVFKFVDKTQFHVQL